jgi:hypothetical protein
MDVVRITKFFIINVSHIQGKYPNIRYISGHTYLQGTLYKDFRCLIYRENLLE